MSMSEEQRKLQSERMTALNAAKRAAKQREAEVGTEPAPLDTVKEPEHPAVGVTPPSDEDYKDLLQRFQELEAKVNARDIPAPQVPQVGPRGLVGTYEKYVIDPANYANPVARLAQEPRLKRFAFTENYELGWNVGVTSYETKDGISTREPKFTLELHRIMIDEDTGEPTNSRYTVCRLIFHEDPQAALVVARENGFDVASLGERDFLDEMRYLRMRDWLLEAFYPPKPSQEKKNRRDVVIGNKLVEVFEINSESSEAMPFGELTTKL